MTRPKTHGTYSVQSQEHPPLRQNSTSDSTVASLKCTITLRSKATEHSHTIHVWYIYHYLPTFTLKISQMEVNIPYMDGMGLVDTNYCGFSYFNDKNAQFSVSPSTRPNGQITHSFLHLPTGTP